jgi:hypothetical protein
MILSQRNDGGFDGVDDLRRMLSRAADGGRGDVSKLLC